MTDTWAVIYLVVGLLIGAFCVGTLWYGPRTMASAQGATPRIRRALKALLAACAVLAVLCVLMVCTGIYVLSGRAPWLD
jgi:formate/nitrite transporter FocA (FNT family)